MKETSTELPRTSLCSMRYVAKGRRRSPMRIIARPLLQLLHE